MPAVISTAQEGETVDLESRFVDALSARGLVPSTALKLIRSIPATRLLAIADYIDYWDTIKKNKDVHEGLLYRFIEQGSPLPANFETRQSREARKVSDERRREIARAKEDLTAQYREYRAKTIADFMAAMVSPDEFERRVIARKHELTITGGSMENMLPKLADSMIRSHLRAEIAKEADVLSFEDFSQKELARGGAQFEPAEIRPESVAFPEVGEHSLKP